MSYEDDVVASLDRHFEVCEYLTGGQLAEHQERLACQGCERLQPAAASVAEPAGAMS